MPTPPLFADFLDTLGWGCFFVFLMFVWAFGAAASALGNLFKSDTAKDIAQDVAGEVARSWLEEWFDS
jgi:hypothetical protein